jgi:hypothetical protein
METGFTLIIKDLKFESDKDKKKGPQEQISLPNNELTTALLCISSYITVLVTSPAADFQVVGSRAAVSPDLVAYK